MLYLDLMDAGSGHLDLRFSGPHCQVQMYELGDRQRNVLMSSPTVLLLRWPHSPQSPKGNNMKREPKIEFYQDKQASIAGNIIASNGQTIAASSQGYATLWLTAAQSW